MCHEVVQIMASSDQAPPFRGVPSMMRSEKPTAANGDLYVVPRFFVHFQTFDIVAPPNQ
jgi:hypothetical protein